MSEKQSLVLRTRRSRQEADQLLAEFETSRVTRKEFSRRSGIPVHVLDYHRRRRRLAGRTEGHENGRLLEVSLAVGKAGAGSTSGLSVVLNAGRRIEVQGGFDEWTLERLVTTLERF